MHFAVQVYKGRLCISLQRIVEIKACAKIRIYCYVLYFVVTPSDFGGLANCICHTADQEESIFEMDFFGVKIPTGNELCHISQWPKLVKGIIV